MNETSIVAFFPDLERKAAVGAGGCAVRSAFHHDVRSYDRLVGRSVDYATGDYMRIVRLLVGDATPPHSIC